jgi:hypothetical protein
MESEDTEDTEDDEIKLALSISMNEYNESYINNIEINNQNIETNNFNEHINEYICENSNLDSQSNNDEHLSSNSDEHFDENSNEHFDKHFNEQIQLALEISQKEHEDEILKFELIKLEGEKLLNIENRKKSLQFFSNIIKKLSYTPEDIKLKNKIIPLLDNYYNLIIDIIYLDRNTYTQLYNIIDLYYLIPIKKGNITKITKEEDELIRSVFLLKVN